MRKKLKIKRVLTCTGFCQHSHSFRSQKTCLQIVNKHKERTDTNVGEIATHRIRFAFALIFEKKGSLPWHLQMAGASRYGPQTRSSHQNPKNSEKPKRHGGISSKWDRHSIMMKWDRHLNNGYFNVGTLILYGNQL